MSTDEHQASINRLREETAEIIRVHMQDLREQIDRLRKEIQMLKERNERLESNARRG